MPLKPLFVIRPLSLEMGFELQCAALMVEPLRVGRLIEAVLAAAQLGQGTDAEVQILNTLGQVVEVLALKAKPTRLMAA